MTPGSLPDSRNLIDPGNRLIAMTPTDHTLDAGTAWTPGGMQLAVLTVRTPDATVTVKLTPGQLKKNWCGLLNALAASLSDGGLITGTAARIPPPAAGDGLPGA